MNDKKKRREFSRAYREYYPIVFNTIYKRTGKLEDTEDICHEVFIGFYNNLEDIREIGKWLMGTAKNQISMFYRNKSEKIKDRSDIKDIEDSIDYAFENGLKDLRIIIEQEIENPDNYRDETEKSLFELIAILKYSYREAALQLGLSVRQLRYRYARITERIVDSLKKRGIESIEDLL